MAKQDINIGIVANDGTGDDLRTAMLKINSNFTEVYQKVGLVNDPTPQLGTDLDTQGHSITNGIANGDVTIAVNGSGKIVLGSLAISGTSILNGSYVLSIPAATDVVVARATADTLSNKTMNFGTTGNNTFRINSKTINGYSGTGDTMALQSNASLIAPVISNGSYDGLFISPIDSPGANFNITPGITVDFNNSMTLTGSEAITVDFGNGGTVLYGGGNSTGSGKITLATSPTFTTSIDCGTTFSAFASATNLTIGSTSTGNITSNYGTATTASGSTKTINIGTGGASGSTTNINIGSSTGTNTGTTTLNNDVSMSGNATINGLLGSPQVTKTYTATGTAGQICWDSNYIYVCVGTNFWKRVALTGGAF